MRDQGDIIKERTEKLVDVYIGEQLSGNEDAGWMGESLLARCMVYLGDIPPPSGNDQPDLAMINAVSQLRDPHVYYDLAVLFLSNLSPKWQLAIMAHRFYKEKIDPRTLRAYSDEGIADLTKMQLREYRYNRDKAYKEMAPWVRMWLIMERVIRRAA